MAGYDNPSAIMPHKRFRDNLGRLKVGVHQNIYDADFEYGSQPLRWEPVTAGSGSIVQLPQLGGVQMTTSTASGDIAIRQTRPYHRYQPGKTMLMASNINFGGSQANHIQRVGFFDDGNGIFFEQNGNAGPGNPYGMYVVVRSDSGNPGYPSDTRIPLTQWNGDIINGTSVIPTINWSVIQMIWMEYAWYGAGLLRWGIYLNGDPYVLHEIGTGNGSFSVNANPLPAIISGTVSGSVGTLTLLNAPVFNAPAVGSQTAITLSGFTPSGWNGTYLATWASSTTLTINFTGTPPTTATVIGQNTTGGSLNTNINSGYNALTQQIPWSRTGNLPARYELRNTGTNSAARTFIHYGVSIIVEGRTDPQRGFTYSYGMAPQVPQRTVASNTVRYPVLSIQPNLMGTIQYGDSTSFSGGTASTAATTTTLTSGTATWTVNQWQGRMLYYLAALPAISSGSVSGSTGTITFASNHNLTTGNTIIISGATPSGWNGTFNVTVTSATVITVQFGAAVPASYTSGATVTSPTTARITSNTATVLTFGDVVTGNALPNAPSVGGTYQVGLINRGQFLPQSLIISASALCVVELIASTPGNQVSLTGASFVPLNTLGSKQSFASRDVSSTGLAGGEVVYAFVSPAGGSGIQTFDLQNFFPILNTVRGNQPDILTVAVTTQSGSGANVGCHIICQEAMS